MMPRLSLVLLGCLVAGPARADDRGTKQTIAYLQKLQTPGGGFLAKADDPGGPTLRATSAGVRALGYLGGAVPDADGAARFVASCFDPPTGGFADAPRGKPDVFTTAVGAMAVAALKMPMDKFGPPAAKFLTEEARGFEEVRIAAAGFEAIGAKAPRAAAWADEVRATANPDGGYGKGPGEARATGGAVAALLRLGADLKDREALAKVLADGQRRSGGYGKDDAPTTADLETTYRVMRSLHMLKVRPRSVEGVRSFVAKCRNEDGGYGVAPGQPSTVGGTYYAAIIRHWLERKE